MSYKRIQKYCFSFIFQSGQNSSLQSKFVQCDHFCGFDPKMNTQLIFIVSSIACLTLSHVVLAEKYQFIGDCKGDQHSDGCFRHLTFICDRAKVVHNDCFSDANLSYSSNHVFYKSTIRKISFENCDQPAISSTIFRKYHNVNDLNISHLGLTMDQMRFLAEPNVLTQIDASHNNLATILNGKLHSKLFSS